MPIYRFACADCGTDFEELLPRPPSPELPSCPDCAGKNVNQLLGLPNVGQIVKSSANTNCRGDGPPCGAPMCGRRAQKM